MTSHRLETTDASAPEGEQSSIPVLTYDQYCAEFDTFAERGQRVEVQDFPIEHLRGITDFPCDDRSVRSLAERIFTAHFDESTHPQREGVLDNVKVILVPDDSGDEKNTIQIGDHSWSAEVTNGFHRILAKMALATRYPEHFTPTVPVEIQPGTWEKVCRLRAQAQEDKITVAPARILPFILRGYAQTQFGRRIHIATALNHQNLVDDVATHFRGRDLRTLKRDGLERTVREKTQKFCIKQKLSPEEYWDIGWAALYETHLILSYFNLTPEEAMVFIRIGRSLAPEIASRVRRLDPRGYGGDAGDLDNELVVVVVNEIPHTVADFLSGKFGGHPNYPMQRAIARVMTDILSEERESGIGVGDCRELISIVDEIGIQEILDHRWNFVAQALGHETRASEYTEFLTSVVQLINYYRPVTTPEMIEALRRSITARVALLPQASGFDDIFSQLNQIFETHYAQPHENSDEPDENTQDQETGSGGSGETGNRLTLFAELEPPPSHTRTPPKQKPEPAPARAHPSQESELAPFRAIVDTLTRSMVQDKTAFIRAFWTAIRLAGRLSIQECLKNGYSDKEKAAILDASDTIAQNLPQILRQMGVPYFSEDTISTLEEGRVSPRIQAVIENIVATVAQKSADSDAVDTYLTSLFSQDSSQTRPGDMVRAIRGGLTAQPIPQERAQELQNTLLAALARNAQRLYQLLLDVALEYTSPDHDIPTTQQAVAFADSLADLGDPDTQLSPEDEILLRLTEQIGL